MNPVTRGASLILAVLLLVQPLGGARADIVLSQLIVDLQRGGHAREDIEIWNKDSSRAYVAVEPAEIVDPGRPSQSRRSEPDPEKLGLFVAPARMILEPGQRKLIRIAALGSDAGRERVYRVTVKPVSGPLSSDNSGLKVLVGYDALVVIRPQQMRPSVTGTRTATGLVLHNEGNVSVELVDGRQCDQGRQHCVPLPSKRLYAGAGWTVALPGNGPVDYSARSPAGTVSLKF